MPFRFLRFVLCASTSAALASPTAAESAPHFLRATVLNEAIAVPFTRLFPTPVHPGMLVGTSLWARELDGVRFPRTHRMQLDLSLYRHPLIEMAVVALPTWQTTWRPWKLAGLSLLGGIGYKHSIYPGETYARNEDTGVYEPSTHWGHPEATAVVGFGLDVSVSDGWSVIAQYRGSVDGPFSSTLGMPVMTHLTTHLGVEYRR